MRYSVVSALSLFVRWRRARRAQDAARRRRARMRLMVWRVDDVGEKTSRVLSCADGGSGTCPFIAKGGIAVTIRGIAQPMAAVRQRGMVSRAPLAANALDDHSKKEEIEKVNRELTVRRGRADSRYKPRSIEIPLERNAPVPPMRREWLRETITSKRPNY